MPLTALQRWSAFWFTEEDPRRFAIMRIGWALASLGAMLRIGPHLELLYTEQGILPARLARQGWAHTHLLANDWWILTELWQAQAAWGCCLGLLLLTLVGLGGRVPLVLSWLLLLSFEARNPLWPNGGNYVLRVFGFYLLLMPVTSAWSLDALWRSPKPAARWAVQLFRINLCLLYLATGLDKAWFGEWWDGSAVALTMVPGAYARFPWMEQLLSHPLTPWLSAPMSWSVLAWELTFWLVFFGRFRRWVLLFGLILHSSISVLLDVPPFSSAILSCYLAFVALPRRG